MITNSNINHFGPFDDTNLIDLYYKQVNSYYRRRYDDARQRIHHEAEKRESKQFENKKFQFRKGDVVKLVRSYKNEGSLILNSVYINGVEITDYIQKPKKTTFKTTVHDVLNYYKPFFIIDKFQYPVVKTSNTQVTPFAILKELKDQKKGNKEKGHFTSKKVEFKRHSDNKKSEYFNLEHLIIQNLDSSNIYKTKEKFLAPIEVDIDLQEEDQYIRQCQLDASSPKSYDPARIKELKQPKYDTTKSLTLLKRLKKRKKDFQSHIPQLEVEEFQNVMNHKNVHKKLKNQHIITYIDNYEKAVLGVLGEYNKQNKMFKIRYETFDNKFLKDDEVDIESDKNNSFEYLQLGVHFSFDPAEYIFRFPHLIKYLFDIDFEEIV